jgi:hypothetical protein
MLVRARPKRCHLGPVAADVRTAPSPVMRLGSVVEPKDAVVSFAGTNEFKISMCQEVRYRFGDRSKKLLDGSTAVNPPYLNIGPRTQDELRVTGRMLQKGVQRVERRTFARLSGLHCFQGNFPQLARLSQQRPWGPVGRARGGRYAGTEKPISDILIRLENIEWLALAHSERIDEVEGQMIADEVEFVRPGGRASGSGVHGATFRRNRRYEVTSVTAIPLPL